MARRILALAALAAMALGVSPARAHNAQRTYIASGGASAAGNTASLIPGNCDGALPASHAGVCFLLHATTGTFRIKVEDASGLRIPVWIRQRSDSAAITTDLRCLGGGASTNTSPSYPVFPGATRVSIATLTVGDGCLIAAPGTFGSPTTGTMTYMHAA